MTQAPPPLPRNAPPLPPAKSQWTLITKLLFAAAAMFLLGVVGTTVLVIVFSGPSREEIAKAKEEKEQSNRSFFERNRDQILNEAQQAFNDRDYTKALRVAEPYENIGDGELDQVLIKSKRILEELKEEKRRKDELVAAEQRERAAQLAAEKRKAAEIEALREQAKEAERKARDGNAIVANADSGTSLQKEQHKQKYLGKTLEFKGRVQDVITNNSVEVMLDVSNYANVTFSSTDVSSWSKGKLIQFTAVIEEFGTGILIKHDLGEAKLIP